jgi:hypothetical protein
VAPIDIILELLPESIAESIRVEYAIRLLGGAPSRVLSYHGKENLRFHVSRPYMKTDSLGGRASRVYFQRIRLHIDDTLKGVVEVDMLTAQQTKLLLKSLGFKFVNAARR